MLNFRNVIKLRLQNTYFIHKHILQIFSKKHIKNTYLTHLSLNNCPPFKLKSFLFLILHKSDRKNTHEII